MAVITNRLTKNRRDVATLREHNGASALPAEACEALDKATIAELSVATIDRLTGEELCRVIRAAELPSLGGIDIDA